MGTPEEPRITKISASLTPQEKQEYIEFLRRNITIFAWSYQDMPGLEPSLVEHRLILKEGVKPVKQKLRKLPPDIQQKVKDEVTKLSQAGFIRTVDYSDWISNRVPGLISFSEDLF